MSQYRNSDVISMHVTQFTYALCLNIDPDSMHPSDESPTNPHNKSASNSSQKGLCLMCVHKSECLELAIATHAEGIWGATGTRERRRIVRDRIARGEFVPEAGVNLHIGSKHRVSA